MVELKLDPDSMQAGAWKRAYANNGEVPQDLEADVIARYQLAQ
jgi:hypothetical protein